MGIPVWLPGLDSVALMRRHRLLPEFHRVPCQLHPPGAATLTNGDNGEMDLAERPHGCRDDPADRAAHEATPAAGSTPGLVVPGGDGG